MHDVFYFSSNTIHQVFFSSHARMRYTIYMLFDRFKKNSSASVGRRGEDLATAYLKKHHYEICDRNYRNKRGTQVGEIDIITRKEEMIIFIEVKARTVSKATVDKILPQEQITATKLRRLQKTATAYLHENNLIDTPYRFDAITVKIFRKNEHQPIITHMESIFL